MAESITAVHVEFTASTASVKKEMKEGAQAVEGFSAAAQRAARQASTGAGAGNTFTASFGRVGEQARGASASISGFTQLAIAMGAKASPAIKGMGSALSTLLASGFTPLGLAIGAATAAMSVFSDSAKDVMGPAIEEAAAYTKSLKDELSGLLVEIRAADARKSKRSIVLGDEQGTVVRGLEQARKESERIAADVRASQERLAAIRVSGTVEEINFEKDNLAGLKEEEKAQARVVRALSARFEMLSRIETAMEKLEAVKDRGRNDFAGATVEDYQFSLTDPMDPRTAEDIAAANHARRERERLYDERQRLVIAENQADAFFAAQMREWEERQAGSNGMETADPTKGAERVAGDAWRPHRLEAEKTLTSIEVMSQRAADGFSDGFSDAFASFATGAKSASDAFRSFAGSFLADIAQMITKQLALSALTGAAGAVGLGALFGGGSAAAATADLGGIGFATGGSFKVRGTGGTDSQLVGFRATPGEEVRINPPGKSGDGVHVTSVVHNYAPGTTARTETSNGPSGPEIRTYIEQVVTSDVERGGPISRTMERTHGLQRRGRRG